MPRSIPARPRSANSGWYLEGSTDDGYFKLWVGCQARTCIQRDTPGHFDWYGDSHKKVGVKGKVPRVNPATSARRIDAGIMRFVATIRSIVLPGFARS